MTPEEREMLSEFADKIAKTPAPARDVEADEFSRTSIGKRPDALYILTQTALIQNLAIQHAQQEIQELKQRLAQLATSQPRSSFLGADVTPGTSRPVPTPAGPSPWSSPVPTPPAVPQSVPPAAEGSSFLRSAAQTAAGVVAGAFAFEGIRALFGGSGGWGGTHLGSVGGGGFLGGAPGSETIINNYYDTPGATERDVSESHEHNDRGSDDSNDAQTSTAPDDSDASNDDTDAGSDDASNEDDSSAGDASYDDGGGSGGDDFV